MRKFLLDLFTEKNGNAWSLARVAWAVSLITFLGLSSYDVLVSGTSFDMQAFGIGLGAVVVAGGAAIGFQAKTEADT